MKVFVSQPMNGRSDKEILDEREKIINKLIKKGFEVVESYYSEFNLSNDIKNKHIYFLAKSILDMSKCDYAYFAKGWQDARGCVIEHDVALKYGLTILLEEGDNVEKS